MAWERKISRTVRVRDDQTLGQLAGLLTAVSSNGGTLGNIELLNKTSRSVVRDITIYGNDVEHIEKIVKAMSITPGTKILEVRDEVLELHQKGKIAIRSRSRSFDDHSAARVHAGCGRSVFEDRERSVNCAAIHLHKSYGGHRNGWHGGAWSRRYWTAGGHACDGRQSHVDGIARWAFGRSNFIEHKRLR